MPGTSTLGRPARAAREPRETSPARTALRGGGLLVLAALLLFLVALSTWIGAKDTSLGQVWTAIWNDDGSYATDVIRQLRLPRTLVGLMTGAALGVAGAVMQAVTRNPLADPGLLGVNAGASAAVVFGIGVIGLAGFGSLVWFSFVGAALTTVIVYVLGASGRAGPTPVRLALAGAAVSASLSGVIAGLTVFDSATYDYLRFWMVGSLAGREPQLVVQLLPFIVVGLVIALLLARSLNSLALGDELGRALGARIARTRLAAVVVVTLLCGASTAAAGPIAFVGLVVPLVARWLTGPDLRWVLPYSMLLAPVLLLVSDIIGRVALPGDELEVGAVTAVIGAPVFIAMVYRRKEASL
ncbi:iron chelate uptake ABC transporter family permease subunit [Streptomyces sp. SID8359]|uniref:FecCD family ABC transporter permease n=1 Tax=unclassified Streptomyces TaxID=2593676 RepID=UPI00048D25EB|nr:iron chelate uptake ABC transporter family permease subunit [Streptomyces sp. SolWspMP-sol2th]MYT92092.1 iron chelate uptake ABC transporter family permease subunit [Streptomyces sp. SID8359]